MTTTHQRDYPTLDLHGQFEKAAIQLVTNFLDEQSRKKGHSAGFVNIITGQGKHSNSSRGPVLRIAVESLLKRRKMQFRQDFPGVFCVDSRSGEVWITEHQSVDTKVLLTADPTEFALQKRTSKSGGGRQPREFSRSSTVSSDMSKPKPASSDPTLQQVVQEERDLDRAKEQSLVEAQTYRKEAKAFKNSLKTALQASEAMCQQEENDFAKTLQQTMVVSQREEQEAQLREEAELKKAIEDSLADAMPQTLSEDELQHAMAQAIRDSLS